MTDDALEDDSRQPPRALPLLVTCVLVAVGLAWWASLNASFGVAFLLGVPGVAGFLLGYYGAAPLPMQVLRLLVFLAGAFALAFVFQLSGLGCLLVASIAFLAPAAGGMCVGIVVRQQWSRGFSPAKGAGPVLLVAVALSLEAALTPAHDPEQISTTRVLDVDRLAAWDAIMFYADVPMEPPAFARIGLPRPIGTVGAPDRVGAETECRFETGHLKKLVTELRTGAVLRFDVIEQVGIEDRSAELLSGSFVLEDVPGGRTRVTLSTVYRPLLQARAYWRPFERLLCRDLHHHVLEGMRLRASTAAAHPMSSL